MDAGSLREAGGDLIKLRGLFGGHRLSVRGKQGQFIAEEIAHQRHAAADDEAEKHPLFAAEAVPDKETEGHQQAQEECRFHGVCEDGHDHFLVRDARHPIQQAYKEDALILGDLTCGNRWQARL
jgi:hypothetical protein